MEGSLDAGRLVHLLVGHDEEQVGVPHVVGREHEPEQRQGEFVVRREHACRIELTNHNGSDGWCRSHSTTVSPGASGEAITCAAAATTSATRFSVRDVRHATVT